MRGDERVEMNRGASGEVLVVRRPDDGSRVGTVPVDGPGEVRAAVARARKAQAGWASLPVRDRVRHLSGLREILARRADEIADRITAETGKPEGEALTEVAVVVSLCRYYERRAPRLLRPRRVPSGWLVWKRARILQEPYGVVGVISPWNYPFILVAEPVLTALFGGNAVVLKPSERAPFTGAALGELLSDSDLPDSLVQVVQGGPETGAELVVSGVDRLHFTGSPSGARQVLAAAAPRLLPVSLESGGKDAAIVLADADLRRAARGIAFGAFYNAGQTCLATERVFVEESVYEEFLRHLIREAERLRAGSGGEVDVGPLATEAQLDLVEEHLRDAVERGARVVCGGSRVDPASNVFLPTVLADVNERMRVMREETFGPLLPVQSVADAEEAVARTNAHPMGLFASVWTDDRETGRALGERVRSGGVSVNDTLAHWAIPSLPMGGTGESGFSRVRGDEGLLSFTRSKVLLENWITPSREPWWFPYRPRSRRLVRAVLAWEGERGVRRLSRLLGGLLGRGEP
jgi:acyl-CoA reductase-like NAD-dependent aldehyde dehydrogenase